MWAAVLGLKIRMGLENKIGLPREPVPRVREMRKHRFHLIVSGRTFRADLCPSLSWVRRLFLGRLAWRGILILRLLCGSIRDANPQEKCNQQRPPDVRPGRVLLLPSHGRS